jgi:hypothetical protein
MLNQLTRSTSSSRIDPHSRQRLVIRAAQGGGPGTGGTTLDLWAPGMREARTS